MSSQAAVSCRPPVRVSCRQAGATTEVRRVLPAVDGVYALANGDGTYSWRGQLTDVDGRRLIWFFTPEGLMPADLAGPPISPAGQRAVLALFS